MAGILFHSQCRRLHMSPHFINQDHLPVSANLATDIMEKERLRGCTQTQVCENVCVLHPFDLHFDVMLLSIVRYLDIVC